MFKKFEIAFNKDSDRERRRNSGNVKDIIVQYGLQHKKYSKDIPMLKNMYNKIKNSDSVDGGYGNYILEISVGLNLSESEFNILTTKLPQISPVYDGKDKSAKNKQIVEQLDLVKVDSDGYGNKLLYSRKKKMLYHYFHEMYFEKSIAQGGMSYSEFMRRVNEENVVQESVGCNMSDFDYLFESFQ